MGHIAGELRERFAAHGLHLSPPPGRALSSPGTRILARLRHPQLEHTLRRALDDCTNGMQAIDEIALALSHGRRVCRAARPSEPR